MKTKRTSSIAAISIINQNLMSDAADFAVRLKKSLAFFSTTRVASIDLSEIKSKFSKFASSLKSNTPKENGNKIKKFIPLSILALVLIVIIFQAKNVVMSAFGKPTSSTDSRVVISGPIATEKINKQLDIPIKDSTGKVATNIQYLLQSAELRNEIIVGGQKMVSVKGRTFLILNIELTNKYNKEINLNYRDNVRLILPGSDKRVAAGIHSSPAAIQPISTTVTRLGFAVDDDKKDLTLEFGLIDGPKQTIILKF